MRTGTFKMFWFCFGGFNWTEKSEKSWHQRHFHQFGASIVLVGLTLTRIFIVPELAGVPLFCRPARRYLSIVYVDIRILFDVFQFKFNTFQVLHFVCFNTFKGTISTLHIFCKWFRCCVKSLNLSRLTTFVYLFNHIL